MKSTLYVITDGDFTLRNGVPSSNRSHYEIFTKRYTEVFPRVRLLCRVHDREDETALPLAGPGVDVIPMPAVHGMSGLIRHGVRIVRTFFAIPREDTAILLRVPGIFPMFAWCILVLRRMPYAVEAMADADAQFSPGAYNGRFRRFYRPIWTAVMKYQCRYASASSYVTRSALQEKFPPGANRPTCHYTTLDLPEAALVDRPRSQASFSKPRLRLVNVAMMQKHLKGQDVIISALSALKSRGVDVGLWLVGDGDTRSEFEELARSRGVADRVRFLGRANAGEEVFRLLDQCDVFVLPSRQEGLPRVVIEAMARALPCYSADLPGSRELLEPEFLIEGNDTAGWVERLTKAAASPELLGAASARNLELAASYAAKNVRPKRFAFYRLIAGGGAEPSPSTA